MHYIVTCICYSDYRRGWIDNWIYWTQLNYTTRDYTLEFTVRHTHTNLLSPGVFSLVVTSQLSLYSSGPRTSCRPTQSQECRVTAGSHSRPTSSLFSATH
jgi:hypothetical protein